MVGVFCSHCFQACNFVAMIVYQNIPKEIKTVLLKIKDGLLQILANVPHVFPEGWAIGGSVSFPKLDHFH